MNTTRFYWRELKPVEGHYNFQMVDTVFEQATLHNPAMNVGLRFMALDDPSTGTRIPDWLVQKSVKGEWTPYRKTFVPNLDDPLFLEYSQRLLNAFGHRYDGSPNLAYIRVVGSWGEWHSSNFPTIKLLLEHDTSAQIDSAIAGGRACLSSVQGGVG